MPTRSLGASMSLAPADDDDSGGEGKAAADEDGEEVPHAVMDAFADFGIDESNSQSDDEQLAGGVAAVSLDDEPEDGKEEKKSSDAAERGSLAAVQHGRKRRRSHEVVEPVASAHVLDWYKGIREYACDICSEGLSEGWMCSGHGGQCPYAECVSCHDEKKAGAAAAAEPQWTRRLTPTTPLTFTGPAPGPHGIDTTDPLSLFRLFLSNAVMDSIVAATNNYASRKYSDHKVSHSFHNNHNINSSTQ
jgi:hypothetical protein